MTEPFWIVWNPFSDEPPRVKYAKRKDAQREARRLAEANAFDGSYFYVMKAQSCHQMQGRIEDFVNRRA